MDEEYIIGEEGIIFIANYLNDVAGPEFYTDIETGDEFCMNLRVLLYMLFEDGYGEYNLAKYKRWAANFLEG